MSPKVAHPFSNTNVFNQNSRMASPQADIRSDRDAAEAYAVLRRHLHSLENEWRDAGLAAELEQFETQYLEEQTAKELGVAGAIALGLGVLHSTVKAVLPSQVASPVLGGAWALGGTFIIFRLTAGTVRGWVGVMERNERRKRRLRLKVEALEDRIKAMVDTQAALMAAEGPQPPPQAPEVPLAGGVPAAASPPRRRVSPTGSTGSGSSVEMVEAPAEGELTGGAAAGGAAPGGGATPASGSGAASGSAPESLDSWRRYATLGARSKKSA